LDKYPGYAAWLNELHGRDVAFASLALIVGVALLWLLYTRRLFTRLETLSRVALVVCFYGSIALLQIILGGPQ